jgi:hypothetical protein
MSKQHEHNTELAVRIDPSNEDHHIYNNNGTYWVHYTVYPSPVTAERIRRSLKTKDVSEARRKRDAIFAGFHMAA